MASVLATADALLCERARREGRGGEAERALVARYLVMCESEARDYTPRGMDVGDLESEALLALQKAIHAFDPGRGATFRHYAKEVVRNALRDELRRGRRHMRRAAAFGLDDPLPSGEGGTIADLFGDPGADAYESGAGNRDVLARYAASLARAYLSATRGKASEPLRRALESSAIAILASGAIADRSDVEAFVLAIGGKGSQMVLGFDDDESIERGALRIADAHLAAAIRSAEGDETFRQAAAGLDPQAAIAAIRLVAEEALPRSPEA